MILNVKNVFNYVKASKVLAFVLLFPFYFFRFIFYSFKEGSLFYFRYYPGYHGSTIPSLKFVKKNRARIFKNEIDGWDGIDLNKDFQIGLLEKFMTYYADFKPSNKESSEALYFYENDMFGFNDGFVLYCFLRFFKPKNVVEVGSGYSSGLMIDTCENFLPDTNLIFIDPYSKNILKTLEKRPLKEYKLIRSEVQDVEMCVFDQLKSGDILFIDTSHVIKIGSDLSYLLFSVLPSLSPGVIIHIHDIWYPWEYPEQMILEGRAYNEAYFIRSFLQYNNGFEVLFFNSFLEKKYTSRFMEMPGFFKNTGKSLWIRKVD